MNSLPSCYGCCRGVTGKLASTKGSFSIFYIYIYIHTHLKVWSFILYSKKYNNKGGFRLLFLSFWGGGGVIRVVQKFRILAYMGTYSRNCGFCILRD